MPGPRWRVGMWVVCLCFAVCEVRLSPAQTPSTWWPDPSSGLMWTGRANAGSKGKGMTWREAKDYCSSLQLGGYSGWRLPAADEITAIAYSRHVDTSRDNRNPYDTLSLKGGIEGPYPRTLPSTWTSTLFGSNKALYGPNFPVAPFNQMLLASKGSTLCVRTLGSDLRQIAERIQVVRPVQDVPSLNASLPFAKAQQAYQAGRYQESIDQAKNALLLKSDFAPAYWAIGISYGMLGQWDLAVTNLGAALKIDENYDDAKNALKWAQMGQESAKKGKALKIQSPQWNWVLDPPVCYEQWVHRYLACGS
jgi:tetratricopeptide (TPR) repeat protein